MSGPVLRFQEGLRRSMNEELKIQAICSDLYSIHESFFSVRPDSSSNLMALCGWVCCTVAVHCYRACRGGVITMLSHLDSAPFRESSL